VNGLYFDNAATTPLNKGAMEAIQASFELFGNPSSVHGEGRKAQKILRDARTAVAKVLGAKPHEILFTSGGSESNNMAIRQGVKRNSHLGRHMITSQIEHPSVLNVMKHLEKKGFEITYLPVDELGNISVEDFENAYREDTILVSLMYVNNEIGAILPIQEIGERLRNTQTLFHVDAVQAFLHEKVVPHELGIDYLSISGHKVNGPKGVGVLFVNDETPLEPLILGGEQEEKRRAGTENILGIAGLKGAIENHDLEREVRHIKRLERGVLDALTQSTIRFSMNGDPEKKSPHVLNLHFPKVNNNLLLMRLDLKQVMISTGSACTAGNIEPSHVLEAMFGKGEERIKESVRISFGIQNTMDEVEALMSILIPIVQEIQNKHEGEKHGI
jgi:cysteine desulfurase